MDLPETVSDIVREYFVNPMQYPDKYAPYNIVNTVVYAALALLAVWLIFEGLKRVGLKADEGFYFAILSFVVFGSAVRVITDAGILPREVTVAGNTFYPFITPGIYVVVFLVVVASIAASLLLATKKKKAVWWLNVIGQWLAVGALLVLVPLLGFWVHGLLMVLLGLVGVGALKAWERVKKGKTRFSAIELFTAFSQCFDGAATFVGVGIGTPATTYGEQHVVGNFVMDLLGGPLAFYFVKLAFVLAVIFLLRRELNEKKPGEAEEKNYILLIITIFGLAPGVRDALRIIAGV